MSEIIRVENLSYIYNQGMPDATKALDDVSFTVEEGDFVGIIGSTGSGKSTLISHFNGLNRPTSQRGASARPKAQTGFFPTAHRTGRRTRRPP